MQMDIIPGEALRFPLPTSTPAIIDVTMLWVPPGVFVIGSPADEPGRIPEEETQVEVTISTGFWLGQSPVTQSQWQGVMQNNPSYFDKQGLAHPVENISWHQAINFCHTLNKEFGVYLPEGYIFTLPSEAQWEYACRAGTRTIYYSGNTLTELSGVAWHAGNSSGHSHPVGKKAPNLWGLYDMHGNVFEWCFDSPSDYPSHPTTDWIGTDNRSLRVIRGGSWKTTPDDCSLRCACRGYVEPEVKSPWIGFRLCLSVRNQ
jgi:formylglycine-generating enzyme required for sulfatase activity